MSSGHTRNPKLATRVVLTITILSADDMDDVDDSGHDRHEYDRAQGHMVTSLTLRYPNFYH